MVNRLGLPILMHITKIFLENIADQIIYNNLNGDGQDTVDRWS